MPLKKINIKRLLKIFKKKDYLIEDAFALQKIKKLNYSNTNKRDYSTLNAIEKIQFNIMKENYRKNSELSSLSEEELDSFVDVDDLGSFIANPDLHIKFLTDVNKIFKTEIMLDSDELEKKYDLFDFYNLETAYSSKNPNDLLPELRKNKRALSDKYLICEKNLMIPLIDKDTGEKVLAVAKPNFGIKEIYHDKIILVSIDVISKYYRIIGLEFLENIEDGDLKKTPRDLASRLLQYMIDEKLSDLQLYLHTSNAYGVSVRKNGNSKIIATRISMPTGIKVTEALLRMMQDEPKTTKPRIDKKLTYQSKTGIRNFRISMINQSKSGVVSLQKFKAVDIRLLGDNSFIKDIRNLGYGNDVIQIIKNAVRNSHGGLYLIAGATNSGKTTTLYAILYDLYMHLKSNGQTKKILTIDSPLEYDIDGFISVDIQDSADNETPITIPQAIHSFLRQDPDICAITEMRSKEDFEAFMEMGLRGHPTFGTLHTTSAKGTISFLEEQVDVSPLQLRENIKLILHVDLVEKVCPNCHGKGEDERACCLNCLGTGHLGVIPIYELVYFLQKSGKASGFNPAVDNIFDFETLVKENKMVWIRKEEIAKRLYAQNLISESTYMQFSGEAEAKVLDINKTAIAIKGAA